MVRFDTAPLTVSYVITIIIIRLLFLIANKTLVVIAHTSTAIAAPEKSWHLGL